MKVLVMKNDFLIEGPCLKPVNEKVKMLIIFFHGWGSNGDDLIQLAPLFAEHFPSAYFLSPNGPEECPQNPFGGKQWFGLDFNTDGSIDRTKMPEKVALAAEHVKKYIAYWQNKLSLSDNETILVGFSQGSMLSLEIGTKSLFGGLLCYSGSFIKKDRSLTKDHKIMLIHGESDEVIPLESMRDAQSALIELGAKVESHISKNLGHSIDGEGINKGIEFIKKCNIYR